MVISCQSGSASWNYTSLPVCLKGLFCINHKSTKFLNIYILVCDSLPTVENSRYDYSISIEREGNYLAGTKVTYNCNDNYVQIGSDIVCGVDGTWSGKVKCYLGKCIVFFLRCFFNPFSSLDFIKIFLFLI